MNLIIMIMIIKVLLPPSVAEGGYVFGSVGLSVCLFVDNITQ